MKRDRVIKDVLHYYDAENHKYVPYSLEALTESITNYEYKDASLRSSAKGYVAESKQIRQW